MPQYSKIRALPKDLQDDLAEWLDHGATYDFCAKELNDEIKRRAPDLDHIIKDAPITQQNIYIWKHSDYAARKVAEEIRKGIEKHAEQDKRQEHLAHLLGWLTAKIAAEIVELDRNPPEPEQYAKRIQELITATINLQKIENDARWIAAEERRVNTGEARLTMTLKLHARKMRKENKEDAVNKRVAERLAPLAPRLIQSTLEKFEELAGPEAPRKHPAIATLTPEQDQILRETLTEEQLEALGFDELPGEPDEDHDEQDAKRDTPAPQTPAP